MYNNEPEVKILADSVNENGVRLTTFQLKYWRPILVEMNTHRVISKNASSSRAMGFDRLCNEVENNIWLPMHWNAEQKGMTGGKEFSPSIKNMINQNIQYLGSIVVHFLQDLDNGIEQLTGSRIQKQYINRYLEPFRCTDQIVTATDWDNFFKLRTAPDAQPEIRDVAIKMQNLLALREPKKLQDGEWHLPYISEEDMQGYGLEICKKISVARCARVCNKPYTGNRKLGVDLDLYEQLAVNGHLSCFEHVAMADSKNICKANANFNEGWAQLRHLPH